MASFTRDFGLNRFGGAVGGSIADDGYKFSTVDRDFLDVALDYLENHTHAVYDKLGDPSGPPTGSVSSTGGVLAPGLELHYVVTYLDQNGMETGRSASLIVNTPDVGASPGLPALTGATGGALVVGNYSYWLTIVTDGVESAPSMSASITLQAGQGTVTITAVDGTAIYNVYRAGPADSAPYKVAQIESGTSYTDVGYVAPSDVNYDPTQLLPTAGVGLPGTYSVTISVPEADASEVNGLPAWRLYCAVGSDTFESPTLVHTVVETVHPGSGGLVTSWVDTGEARLYGQPPYVSQTMSSAAASGSGGGGSRGGAYTENPILVDEATREDAYGFDVTPDGGLALVRLARYGTPYPIGYGPVLTDANAGLWLVSVVNAAIVTTSLTAAVPDDTVFANGKGPKLMLGRGSRFQLDIDIDGALILNGLDGAPASGTGVDGAATYGTGGEVADPPPTDDDAVDLPDDRDATYSTVLLGPSDNRVWNGDVYLEAPAGSTPRYFAYTAPDTSPFTISLAGGTALGLFVFDAQPTATYAPKPVASGNPVTVTPTAGTTYFIAAGPTTTGGGDTTLTFTVASGGGGTPGDFTTDFEEGF